MPCFTKVSSPLGGIHILGDRNGIEAIILPSGGTPTPELHNYQKDYRELREAAAQLAAYFTGELQDFDLPLSNNAGTEFQRKVWQALIDIPYGDTTSYGDIAERIGSPKAVRAVGAANGRNPLAIVVPCHRVIGANGSLTGYAAGVDNKRWLLAHEARFS